MSCSIFCKINTLISATILGIIVYYIVLGNGYISEIKQDIGMAKSFATKELASHKAEIKKIIKGFSK